MSNHFTRSYQYAAPLSEKPEDDLLHAIGTLQLDAADCRTELENRGWTDEQIDAQAARAEAKDAAQRRANGLNRLSGNLARATFGR